MRLRVPAFLPARTEVAAEAANLPASVGRRETALDPNRSRAARDLMAVPAAGLAAAETGRHRDRLTAVSNPMVEVVAAAPKSSGAALQPWRVSRRLAWCRPACKRPANLPRMWCCSLGSVSFYEKRPLNFGLRALFSLPGNLVIAQ
jgi:hypothetical protein